MSLDLPTTTTGPSIALLRTPDQHEAWRTRITDKCWAKTGRNILAVTDAACIAALTKIHHDDAKDEDFTKHGWVTTCWYIITQSLHDEILLKVAHVERGYIETMLKEIASALTVYTLEEVGPLRLELYAATMEKCGNDLQSFIAYIQLRQRKLTFLKKGLAEEDLIAIFINGLHPVLHAIKIHLRIATPEKWEGAVAVVRAHCASPEVSADLQKLKSAGLSQHMFPLQHHHLQQQRALAPSSSASSPSQSANSSSRLQPCRNFARGRCTSGTNCRFSHTALPAAATQQTATGRCAFCFNRGHVALECRKRLAQLATLPPDQQQHAIQQRALVVHTPPQTAASSTPSAPQHADLETEESKCAAPLHHDDDANFFTFVFLTCDGTPLDSWVLDSGATSSATFDERDCEDIHECDVQVTAAGSDFRVTKMGTAIIEALDEKGRTQKLTIKNCLISPAFPCKLLSLSAMTKKGMTATMTGDRMRISNPNNDIVLLGVRNSSSQLFLLQQASPPPGMQQSQLDSALLAKSYQAGDGTELDLLWKLHLRHGHRNFADLARQYKLTMPKQTPACTSCVMGKAHSQPKLSQGFERATRRAEGFHSDFRGPFSVPTPEGYHYLLTIIDDYTRRIFGFLAKSQSEWFEIWSKFVVRIEAELGKPHCISWLLSDNGAVYKSMAMTQFCSARGIQQRFSGPYSQWMNHTAERNMRTIGEMTTTTLIHANLPKRAWGYATMLAIDVINRTADSVQPNFKNTLSRLERWKGKELPGQTKGLYPLGCLAFKLVPPQLRTKLDAHASPHVYLGIDQKSRAFLLGSLFDLKLSVTVEATFMEHKFPFRQIQTEESPASLLWGTQAAKLEGDPRHGMFDMSGPGTVEPLRPVDLKTLKTIYAQASSSNKQQVPSSTVFSPPPPPTPTTTTMMTTRPAELKLDATTRWDNFPMDSIGALPSPNYLTQDNDGAHTAALVILSESMMQTATPRHAHQAVSSSRAVQWIAAMNREKACHLKNGTFGEEWKDHGTKPAKVTPADWVFRIKHRGPPIDDSQLLPNQFKARVVIKGQFMKEGIDFNDTFAPVAKHVTLRALFAVATKHGCKLITGDVETAFLSSPIDCEIWIRMPPYWGKDADPITGEQRERPPRRLLKGVPGIPQGSRLFYTAMAHELKSMNYLPSAADQCLFVPATPTKERVAVLLWVDDFVLMYEQEQTAAAFLTRLRKRFNIPTVGALAHFLGMDIQYNPKTRKMFLSQEHTTEVLLERAQMQDCNATQTPCPANTVFSKRDCPAAASPRTTEYASLVALANYLACWTRPDIAFTVNKLCKFMSNPGDTHWQLLKHLLRYLKGTKHKGLLFDFSSSLAQPGTGLHGYCDSSHADCPDTRHSTLAYVFRLDNAVLSWFSKLHSYVTSCTNHSEYAALFAAAKEAQWLVYLFQDLKVAETELTPIPIYIDSSGVVSMVFNPVDHKSNKHVEIAHHFSRELTEKRVITPQRLPSAENIADALTKPLALAAFSAVVPKLVNIIPNT